MGQLRRTAILRNLRASLMELMDELLAFLGFFAALLTGLYYGSWWVFGGVLIFSFLLSLVLRRVLTGRN